MTVPVPAIVEDPSPNHSPRSGVAIQAIVEHIEDGTEQATDSWFDGAASHVSAHYSVAKDGTVRRHVADSEAAWANGALTPAPAHPTPLIARNGGIDPNYWSLSIEHEGKSPDTPQGVQWEASVALTAWLCEQHGIAPSRDTIIRHSDIGGHLYCPGWSDALMDQYVAAVAAKLNGGSMAQSAPFTSKQAQEIGIVAYMREHPGAGTPPTDVRIQQQDEEQDAAGTWDWYRIGVLRR